MKFLEKNFKKKEKISQKLKEVIIGEEEEVEEVLEELEDLEAEPEKGYLLKLMIIILIISITKRILNF